MIKKEETLKLHLLRGTSERKSDYRPLKVYPWSAWNQYLVNSIALAQRNNCWHPPTWHTGISLLRLETHERFFLTSYSFIQDPIWMGVGHIQRAVDRLVFIHMYSSIAVHLGSLKACRSIFGFINWDILYKWESGTYDWHFLLRLCFSNFLSIKHD